MAVRRHVCCNSNQGVPATDELNYHVARKRCLESGRIFVRALRIDFICEWYLFDIVPGYEPNSVEHCCQRSCCVCSSGEPKKTDLITFLIVLHNELISSHDVMVEVPSNRLVDNVGDSFQQGRSESCEFLQRSPGR